MFQRDGFQLFTGAEIYGRAEDPRAQQIGHDHPKKGDANALLGAVTHRGTPDTAYSGSEGIISFEHSDNTNPSGRTPALSEAAEKNGDPERFAVGGATAGNATPSSARGGPRTISWSKTPRNKDVRSYLRNFF